MIDNRGYTLFIGDLAYLCSEHQLHQAFQNYYPDILEVKIKRAKENESNRSLSYGFITFASMASAENALKAMNRVMLCGRPMRIRWATRKNNDGAKLSNESEEFATASVHVTFVSNQTASLVTEESLREMFSSFGDVIDITINKFSLDVNRQSGYGFIHFANTEVGIQKALNAAIQFKDVTRYGITYRCNVSHVLEKSLREIIDAQSTPPVLPQPQPNPYHLPPNEYQIHKASLHSSVTITPSHEMSLEAKEAYLKSTDSDFTPNEQVAAEGLTDTRNLSNPFIEAIYPQRPGSSGGLSSSDSNIFIESNYQQPNDSSQLWTDPNYVQSGHEQFNNKPRNIYRSKPTVNIENHTVIFSRNNQLHHSYSEVDDVRGKPTAMYPFHNKGEPYLNTTAPIYHHPGTSHAIHPSVHHMGFGSSTTSWQAPSPYPYNISPQTRSYNDLSSSIPQQVAVKEPRIIPQNAMKSRSGSFEFSGVHQQFHSPYEGNTAALPTHEAKFGNSERQLISSSNIRSSNGFGIEGLMYDYSNFMPHPPQCDSGMSTQLPQQQQQQQHHSNVGIPFARNSENLPYPPNLSDFQRTYMSNSVSEQRHPYQSTNRFSYQPSNQSNKH